MAATYQCRGCGQVVPAMGLDDGPVPRCPVCQAALSAGLPPAPEPVTPYPVEIQTPRIVDEDIPEIDIRRWDVPSAPPARSMAGNGARYGWLVIVVGIGLSRACVATMNRPDPPLPQIHVPAFQPPLQWQPDAILPPLPGPAVRQDQLIRPARWTQPLPGKQVVRLIASGPKDTRVAAIVHVDFPAPATILTAFDGASGAPVGELSWNGPTELVDASLSADGSAVAVLLQHANKPEASRLHVYTLGPRNEVLKAWLPPLAAAGPAARVWFAMIGPDQLLTISNQKQLELWTVPDPRRIYQVALEPLADEARLTAAISPDRRTLAIGNRDNGFTFYDTATGAVRGRTAHLADKIDPVGDPKFSPDGLHLGSFMGGGNIAPEGEWTRWSVPDGALVNRWALTPPSWTFLDAEMLINTGRIGEKTIRRVSDGSTAAVLLTGMPPFTSVAGTGRRLWYSARDGLQLVQQSHLSAIELPPALGQNDPRGPAGLPPQTWRLDHDGLHCGR